MKLENTVKNENYFSRISRAIADTASALYHNAAFKIAAPVVLAASLAGCGAKEFFMPEYAQAEVDISSESFGFRAKAKNDSFEADINYTENNSTIRGTNNDVNEKRFTADFNIHTRNRHITEISPVIGSIDRKVKMPDGTTESYLHQKNGFPFLAVGVKGPLRGASNENSWRVRPFVNPMRDKTIVGNIDITQFGLYADADLSSMIGTFRPLFSYAREDVDFGSGIVNPTETQVGVLYLFDEKINPSILGSAGISFSNTTEDDGRNGAGKAVVVGDFTYDLTQAVIGANISHDGDFTSGGMYCSVGGNSTDNAKVLSNFVRQLQTSILERGLPDLENRRNDARQSLEQNIDAKLFFLIGLREQRDTLANNPRPDIYALIGSAFDIKRKRYVAGITSGPVFPDYSGDVVNARYGGFVGVNLDDLDIHVRAEHRDNENREDQDVCTIIALYKF